MIYILSTVYLFIAIGVLVLIIAVAQSEKLFSLLRLTGYILFIASILWGLGTIAAAEFESDHPNIQDIIQQINVINYGLAGLAAILLSAKGIKETWDDLKK
jgi:hypothetical protein